MANSRNLLTKTSPHKETQVRPEKNLGKLPQQKES